MHAFVDGHLVIGRNRVRKLLYSRDGSGCRICYKLTDRVSDLTFDHIVPKSKGRTNDLSNLQLLCLLCNGRKADKTEDF